MAGAVGAAQPLAGRGPTGEGSLGAMSPASPAPLVVAVADRIDGAGIERLRREPGLQVEVSSGLPPEALDRLLARAHALIVRSETRVDRALLEQAPKLRVVGRAGTGVDNIDVDAATRRGVVVVNTPGANTVAAAEHTMALLLALARNVPQAHLSLTRERRWERGRFIGVQLQGKTLGLVGIGRIGSEVARRAQAFEMRVIGYDPYLPAERARRLGVELLELEEVLARADFVSLHAPLSPGTRHMIGRAQLAMLRPGARLVNCARGGLVDEEALLEALNEGRLAGVALDVFEDEPPAPDSLLLAHPAVIATPHLGASTREAQQLVAIEVAEQVIQALRGEMVRSAVNAPSVPPERLEALRPYLDLAERLGRLYTEMVGGEGLHRLEVTLAGEAAELAQGASGVLVAAALRGVLEPVVEGRLTLLNAPMLARERGIEVVENRTTESAPYPSLIALSTRIGARTRQVAGTLEPAFGEGGAKAAGQARLQPRLVRIDGYPVGIDATGHLLVSYHVDRPGIVGRVGTVLGRAGVNIAYMQVGRLKPGGDAVMVLGVDSPVPPEVLEELRSIPEMTEIRAARW